MNFNFSHFTHKTVLKLSVSIFRDIWHVIVKKNPLLQDCSKTKTLTNFQYLGNTQIRSTVECMVRGTSKLHPAC
jgi:hypothetical protein